MLVLGCGGGIGVEYVITVTAWFRRFDGGGESVLVWGGFSYHNRTAHQVCRGRKNAICYRDNVLRNHVIPFFHQHWDMHTYQQDYARSHTARVTTQYLAINGVPLLEWSALSLDLSPIEQVPWSRYLTSSTNE